MKEKTTLTFQYRYAVILSIILSAIFLSCQRNENPAVIIDKPNVLLITIDTLRADHLPLYGYKQVETPNIDKLAADSAFFKKAVAHAPLTLVSHTSIFTGTYPLFHGVRNNGNFYAPDSLNTAAEILKSAGYDTAAFVGSFVLDSRFGLNQGFDIYDDDMIDGRQKKSKFEFKDRLAENIINRANTWLDQRGKNSASPFFLWTHLFDPHKEYEPPEPFKTKYAQNLYDGEIAYTDREIGRLISKLKALNLYDNMLIILTSDHGESLGEHGESTHSIFIYDATTRVPLVIKLPDRQFAGKSIDNMVRHIDILPTLLDVSNLSKSIDKNLQKSIQGISLLPLIKGEEKNLRLTAYAESYLPKNYYNWSPPESIRTRDYKFINLPTPEFYDLRKDPSETDNIYLKQKKQAEEYAKRLKELKANYSRGKIANAARQMDEETIEKLKSLGYIHGGAVPSKGDDENSANRGKDPKDMIFASEEMNFIHQHINRKEYEQAIERVKKLLLKDPENIQARSSLASSYKQIGDIDKAIAVYEKIKKLDPKFISAYLGLCNIYTKKKVDFGLAERELKAAFAIAPKDPSLWVVKGDLEQEKGEIEKALDSYIKALDTGEQSATLYVGMGSAFNKQNKFDKAKKLFEKAIYIDNEYSEAHYNLGVVYEKTGKPDTAEKKYRLAIEQDPQNHFAYTNLGSLMSGKKKYREAMDALKEAVKIKPDHLEAVYNLGTVYLNMNKPGDAIPYFQKAIEIKPSLLFAYNNLALSYSQLGNRKNAFKTYREMAKTAPEMPMPWYSMALLSAAENKKKEAQKYLKEALERGGERVKAMAQKEKSFEGLEF